MIDLNPLDVLHSRKVDRMFPHFTKFKLTERDVFNTNLESWVKTKLKGRYCIIEIPAIDPSGNLKTSMHIGFEDEKELTYFMLACPFLRRN